MLKPLLALFSMLSSLSVCYGQKQDSTTYHSETLKIEKLSEKVFLHISYLDVPGHARFPCNGLVFIDDGEAVVFDTPTSDSAAVELIHWVENEQGKKIKAVVVHHFHNDCLGGLGAFHERGIKSYGSYRTIALAKEHGETVPQHGFEKLQELLVGNQTVTTKYFGEGHTVDNVVSYIPSEKALFGGCLVKELNAGKGNLADANVDEWSATVERIKTQFANIQLIIPGHGEPGGPELLDYTIELFTKE